MFFEMAQRPENERQNSEGTKMQKFSLTFFFAARLGCAEILYTSASARPENTLIVGQQHT